MGAEREPGAANEARCEAQRDAGSYAELCIPGLQEIIREQLPRRRTQRARRATGLEAEILAALWSHGFLFANQIWRRWWPERTRRWAYHALKEMALAGWVERYRLMTSVGGSQQRFYALAEPGFEIARGRRLRERHGIPRDARWQGLVVDRTGGLPRELHVNGWVLALEQLAGELMSAWRGPFESQLLPPRRRVRGQWIEVRPADIVLGTNHRLTGYQANALEAVNPHATVELELPDRTRRELMIEYQAHDDPFVLQERLARYDVFVSGWAHLLDRCRPPARAPIVLLVCPDGRRLGSVVEIADRALTTRVAKAGTPEADWPFPGRRSVLFAVEPDIHEASLRAFAVPQHPPDLRARISEMGQAAGELREVQFIDPGVLPERRPPETPHPRRSGFRSRSAGAKK